MRAEIRMGWLGRGSGESERKKGTDRTIVGCAEKRLRGEIKSERYFELDTIGVRMV